MLERRPIQVLPVTTPRLRTGNSWIPPVQVPRLCPWLLLSSPTLRLLLLPSTPTFHVSPCPGPLHPPLSHLLLLPIRVPPLAARLAQPALFVLAAVLLLQPGSHRPVLVSPLPSPHSALLSCPLLSRSLSPPLKVGPPFSFMRPHIDAHLAGQLTGDIPMDWLRGQGFDSQEVCERVLRLRFNGAAFPVSARSLPGRVLPRTHLVPWRRGLPACGRFSKAINGFATSAPKGARGLLVQMLDHGLG